MSENQIHSSSKGMKILSVTVLILIAGAIAYWWWTPHPKAPSVETSSLKGSQIKLTPQPSITPEPRQAMKPNVATAPSVAAKPSIASKPSIVPQPGVVRQPTKAPAVIDFDKLGKDKVLQTSMNKRKQAYGIEKGIDMVVKPDETIKVGDAIVPMREIEEQIRLHRGEIVESDIPTQNDRLLTPEDRKRLSDQINQRERKFAALEQQLKKLATSEKDAKYQAIETE